MGISHGGEVRVDIVSFLQMVLLACPPSANTLPIVNASQAFLGSVLSLLGQ